MISFLLIVFTAIIFKKDQSEEESVLIEMPAYQLPTLRQNILTSTHEVKHFLARASKFILGGVIIVWFLTNTYLSSDLSVADFVGNTLNPIFDPIGINDKLIIALIFGFIAKEIVIGALAVIFSGNDNALPELLFNYITWQQAISFMIFTLIYTPCLSTIAVIKNQSKSNKLVLTSLVWSLVLAWLISFAAYQSLLFLY